MPFQRQPSNFDFIASAANYVGRGIQAYDAGQKKKAELAKIELSNTQADQVYNVLLESAKNEYKQITGSSDEVKATVFAVKHFQPRFPDETASAAAARWDKSADAYSKSVDQMKSTAFMAATKGTPAVPEKPGAMVKSTTNMAPANMRAIINPEAARSAKLPGTTMISQGLFPGDEPELQLPPTPAQPAKPANYTELKQQADQMGISGRPEVQSTLNSFADRDAGQFVTPGQTAIGYYGAMQKEGMPLTEMSKQVGDAYTKDAALEQRKIDGERRARNSQNSLFQSLLKDNQFRMKMAKDYGDDGMKVGDEIYKLTVLRENLDAELWNAQNYINTDPSKPSPDPSSIMDKMRILDAQIEKLKSALPGFDRMVDQFSNYPSTFRTPITAPQPGPIIPPGTRPIAPSATSSTRTKYGY